MDGDDDENLLMGVKVRHARLVLSPEGHRLLTELVTAALQEQARQSISSDGGALVNERGEYLDLKRSGHLWQDVSYTGRGVRLNAEYASYLEERFRFAALAPQTWERIKPDVRRILESHLKTSEA